MSSKYRCKKQVTRLMAGINHTLAILMSMLRVSLEYAWKQPRVCLEYGWSMARVCQEAAYSEITARFERHYGSFRTALRLVVCMLLLLMVGVNTAWGQKVADGVYYIKNNNSGNWYLWPAITVTKSGNSFQYAYKYLTTHDGTTADAVENNNNVSYPAHDNTYCHWVVKNIEGGYIQLINPKLNKYVVIQKNHTLSTGQDVMFAEGEPSGTDVNFSYFVLNNDESPYKISPPSGLSGINYYNDKNVEKPASDFSFNSKNGNDRTWLTWSSSDATAKAQLGENIKGVIQFYYGGTPLWSFEADKLARPSISDLDANNKVTITENNGLPDGYKIRYTFGDGSQEPTATTETYITNDGSDNVIPISTSGTLKVVVERYGIVLTEVAEKTFSVVPMPTITYNTSNLIEMATVLDGASIYYTTDGTVPSVINGRRYQNPFDPADDVTEIKAIVISSDGEKSNVATYIPPVLLGSNHIRMIQNQGDAWSCAEHLGGHFYMRAASEENLTTTSLFLPDDQWYFLNAGDQYYYIIYDDKRLWCDGTDVKLKVYDSENDNLFKFRLVAYPETGTTTDYNIVPFGLTEGITKPGGNGTADVIALGNSNSEGYARWKFILPSAFDKTAPFTVSNDNQSYFYKIGSDDNYIIQSSETAVTTTASIADEDVKKGSWMMMLVPDTEISVGDEFTYYNIRNAKTNDYLYYTGGETPGFAVSATITEGQEDKYRFTWARSTATDTYYLIPRTQVNAAKSSLINFSTYSITAAPGFVLDPVLTMDAEGIVTMTCATSGSEIFYRIDGDFTDLTGENPATNPEIPAESGKKPTLPTRLYSTDFLLSLDATQVRAVAVLKNDHTVKSSVQLINLEQCGKPTPTDEDFHDAQGSLTIPKVKVGTVGEGDDEHDVYADIYYTIDGTDPALVETTHHGVEPEIAFRYNTRSKVRAVAAKNGMRKSEPYTMDVVYMPSITFQHESYTYSATITDSKIVSQAIEPVITKVQVEGEDDPIAASYYHVKDYRDNTEAGTGKIIIKATPEAPIKLYGIGNFVINKAPISSITVTPVPTEFTYNYRAQGPEITSIIAAGGSGNIELLGFDAYYTVTDNLQVSAGEYTLRVEAKEGTNFTGYVEKPFTIKSKTLNSDDILITVKKEVNGNTVSYVPTLKDGSVTLVEDKDYTYTVDTTNGIVLTFTGKGNYSSAAADKRIYEFIDLPFVRPENSNSDYVAPYAASSDLTTPLGMNAYIVTGVTNKDRVILEEVAYIPKDVPVLMLSGKRADGFGKVLKTSDTYTTAELAAINTKNKLKVNASATEIEAALIYLFYKGEFVLNAAGTLPAGKVYLDLRDTSDPTPAPRLYIVDGGSNTTEIKDVRDKMEDEQNDRWFTLDGRMLQGKPAQKGLYIKNGRKVVIK